MEVNYLMLREDIKFPLKWDTDEYKMYIFDSDDNMVLQVDKNLDVTKEEHPFEKIVGHIIEIGELEFAPNHRYFIHQGDFYDQKKGVRIGCVRGWGRLQYKDNAMKRQDNVANYILFVLNNNNDEQDNCY